MEPNWDLLNDLQRVHAPDHLRHAIDAKSALRKKQSNTFNALMVAASITLILTCLNLIQHSNYAESSDSTARISLIESQQLYYE